VNALLCSDRAADLVAGSLFPDQVVVCGAHALLVPYAEPGLPLARAVRRGLSGYLDEHGSPPRLIHLANHGIVALGGNAAQVLAVTTMAVKAARVLSGVLAVGSPNYLSPDTVRQLDGRADEQHRRRCWPAPRRTYEPEPEQRPGSRSAGPGQPAGCAGRRGRGAARRGGDRRRGDRRRVALDAASRGLSVVLLEAGDLASGTSSRPARPRTAGCVIWSS